MGEYVSDKWNSFAECLVMSRPSWRDSCSSCSDTAPDAYPLKPVTAGLDKT